MNLSDLEIIIALTSVFSSFYLVLQYLLRFQRRIDRILTLLAFSTRRIEDIEEFLAQSSEFQIRRQLDQESLPELDTDFL